MLRRCMMPPRASPSSPRSAVAASSWHSLAETTLIMIARRLSEHNDRIFRARLGTVARGDTIDYDRGYASWSSKCDTPRVTHSRKRHADYWSTMTRTFYAELSLQVRHGRSLRHDWLRSRFYRADHRNATPRASLARVNNIDRAPIVGTQQLYDVRGLSLKVRHGRSPGHDWLQSRFYALIIETRHPARHSLA